MSSEVRAGALLLDKEKPGWWEEVDVDQLDMGGVRNCVLGQLQGDYATGIDKLGISSFAEASRLGFYISIRENCSWAKRRGLYKVLTKAWTKEIADRQAQAA